MKILIGTFVLYLLKGQCRFSVKDFYYIHTKIVNKFSSTDIEILYWRHQYFLITMLSGLKLNKYMNMPQSYIQQYEQSIMKQIKIVTNMETNKIEKGEARKVLESQTWTGVKKKILGLGFGSVLKNTCCSCKRPGSIPSTHTVVFNRSLSLVSGDPMPSSEFYMPSSDSSRHQVCTYCTEIQSGKTFTHKIN